MANLEKLRKRQEKIIQDTLKSISGISGFYNQSIDVYMAQHAQYMAEQQMKLATSIEVSQEAINQVLELSSVASQSAKVLSNSQTVKIFESLPTLADIKPIFDNISKIMVDIGKTIDEELHRHDESLDKVGFGFSTEVLMRTFGYRILEELPFAHHVPDNETIDVFMQIVERPEFMPKLLEPYQNVKDLKKRKKIIEEAYNLHQEERFIASIPLLLIQIEFLVRTLLFLRDQVDIDKDGRKVFLMEDGKRKLGEDGMPVELHGLGEILNNVPQFAEDEILDRLVNLLSTKLAGTRNDILHGTSHKYGKAKTSAQCILAVFCLAHVIYGLDDLDFGDEE